jgi:hypothetical protein
MHNMKTTPQPEKIIVGLDALADMLNMTPSNVRKLVKRGVIQQERRGEYDAVAAIRAYVVFLSDSLRRPESELNLRNEKLRGLQLQNRELQDRLETKLAELIPLPIAAFVFDAVLSDARSLVADAGADLKKLIVELNDPARSAQAVENRTRQLLEELTAIDPTPHAATAIKSRPPRK